MNLKANTLISFISFLHSFLFLSRCVLFDNHSRVTDLAKKLNEKNTTEHIFGGVSAADLGGRWEELQKLYEER
jgi:hypothetical protein